ncbi:MAG TPA: TorF family putative porin [Steroidobacteraceae bacterium]|jgi:uncharacterized protein (TIGR02001 family)
MLLAALLSLAGPSAEAVTFGGDVTAVSDYIYRGVSQNYGDPAAQVDLHLGTDSGFFVGAWGSTLSSHGFRPNFETQLYAGKRFALSGEWSATTQVVDYAYLGTHGRRSYDYQELSLSLTYLDSLNFSVAVTPNAVRYLGTYRIGRYPAYDADVTGQLHLVGALFATGGAGYYYLSGPGGSEPGTPGYAYGNAGLALAVHDWRLDVGYFVAEHKSEYFFPYVTSDSRLAASLSWRF